MTSQGGNASSRLVGNASPLGNCFGEPLETSNSRLQERDVLEFAFAMAIGSVTQR